MFQQTISSELAGLINKLSAIEEIASAFYLAGGTALALQLGHRRSEDLDLFTPDAFDEKQISDTILNLDGVIISTALQTVHASVNNTRVSFMRYRFKLLDPLSPARSLDKIRMASLRDIACMKVMAVAQRAEKKDFFDLYEILQAHSPAQLKPWMIEKYGLERLNCYHILRSFFYFDDANESADPLLLNKTTWDQVKNYFLKNEKSFTEEMLQC